MGLLKVAGPDLGGRDMCRDRDNRDPGTVAVEQAVDQVQIAGSAATGTNGEVAGQVRIRAGGEGSPLLVSDVQPRNLAVPAQAVREPIQAVAHNSINPSDAR